MARIGRPPVPAAERFASKVQQDDNGCLVWTGFLDRDGYGQLAVDGRNTRVHRWSYEYHVGPIPEGLVIDHLCRNRACANPYHLEVVTVQENTLRGNGPTAANAIKTACKRGHPLTPENVYLIPGGRSCRTCRVELTRQWRAKKKAA